MKPSGEGSRKRRSVLRKNRNVLRKRKCEEESKRAEEESKRAEEEKRQRKAAEKRAEETTLLEFLHYCHTYYTRPFAVQTIEDESTHGTTLTPYGRCYPTELHLWTDFMSSQQSRFNTLKDALQSLRLFDPRVAIESKGQAACDRLFASEDDLKFYQRLAVEQPATSVVNTLGKLPRASFETFNIGSGVIFENHENPLRKTSQEASRETSPETSREAHKRQRVTEREHKKLRRLPADQICVYKHPSGNRTLAFIVEYKAPHKISIEAFRRALGKQNLCQEVAERYKRYTDSKEQESAEDRVGKVVAQTFHYMIEKRVKYGYITTGEVYIFLRIEKENPHVLYYHLAVPKEEVRNELEESIAHSAISQVICFCLLTFSSTRRSHKWQAETVEKLKKWPQPYENIGQSATDEDEHRSLSLSPYEPPPSLKISQTSNYGLRSRVTCKESEAIRVRQDSDSGESDNNHPSSALYGTGSGGAHISSERRYASANNDGSLSRQGGTEHRNLQYCTQACLLGLKRGWTLDNNCPNVSSHRTPGSGYHPINAEQLANLVQVQLGQDLDHNFEPLDGKLGARGALLKLTLTRYGYTFVAKGTVPVFVRDLRHEGRVYRRLEKLQGKVVPVYLGNIELIRKYCLDFDVWLVHLLLMSWGGETVNQATVPNLQEEVEQSLKELYSEGVAHGDARHANMLWNAEQQRVMLVDFDCASFLPLPKYSQLSQLGRKRKRQNELSDSATYHRKRVFMGPANPYGL